MVLEIGLGIGVLVVALVVSIYLGGKQKKSSKNLEIKTTKIIKKGIKPLKDKYLFKYANSRRKEGVCDEGRVIKFEGFTFSHVITEGIKLYKKTGKALNTLTGTYTIIERPNGTRYGVKLNEEGVIQEKFDCE